jgi:hypothetical protein
VDGAVVAAGGFQAAVRFFALLGAAVVLVVLPALLPDSE